MPLHYLKSLCIGAYGGEIRRPSLRRNEDLIVQLAEQSGSFGYPVVAAPAGGQHHRHDKVGGVT